MAYRGGGYTLVTKSATSRVALVLSSSYPTQHHSKLITCARKITILDRRLKMSLLNSAACAFKTTKIQYF